MSLGDIASIGEIVAALAVVASLMYLSRQVRQSNLFAKSQVRQRMVEQTHEELYVLMNDAELRGAWRRSTKLSPEAQSKLSFFLAAAMRQREWEWFQFKDGIIDQTVYSAYHEVIAFHLGAHAPETGGPLSAAWDLMPTSSPKSMLCWPTAHSPTTISRK